MPVGEDSAGVYPITADSNSGHTYAFPSRFSRSHVFPTIRRDDPTYPGPRAAQAWRSVPPRLPVILRQMFFTDVTK
nr:MAG TPA: hypothetical protein [Caudoviricetes sp.]